MEIVKSEDLVIPKIMALEYGAPGAGKTTAIAEMHTVAAGEKKLILDVDNSSGVLRGYKGIEIVKIGLDMKRFLEAMEWLENGAYKDYGLICLDNITELEHQMLTEYGKIGKNDGAPELGHYNKTQFKIIDYVRRLRQLPVDVVITAWEDKQDVLNSDGTKYTMLVPKLSGRSADVVCGICNMVARIEQGKESRYFRLEKTSSHYAKDQVYKRKYCSLAGLLTGEVN